MSTKTTFKRIALVAVAALGLGVLSVAPSQATISGNTVTVANGTSAAGQSDSLTAATIAISGFMDNAKDTVTVQFIADGARPTAIAGYTSTAGVAKLAYLETSTAGSTVHRTLGTDYSAQQTGPTGDSVTVSTALNIKASGANAQYGANFTLQLDSVTAPTPGTYNYLVVVKQYNYSLGDTLTMSTSTHPVSITVAKPAALSTTVAAASSTAYIQAGTTTGVASDAVVTAVATASNTARATIQVKTFNANGSAAAESITAVLTGDAGLLCTDDATAICGKSLVIAGDGDTSIFVRSNGTAGTASIAVSTTTATFTTKTVTFYEKSPKTITAALYNPVLKVGSNTSAIAVKAVDSNGTPWTGSLYTIASSATDALVAGSTTAPAACSTALLASTGYIFCPVTTIATGTAKVKIIDQSLDTDAAYTTADSAATSNEVTVTVSNAAPSSIKVAFDKATYAPFEKALITVTVLDKDGKALQGNTYSNLYATGGITANQAFGSSSASDLTTVSVTTSEYTSAASDLNAGAKTYVVYMPAQGDVKVSVTGGTSLAAAGQIAYSATASVVNSSVDAATDAANEATDAANAATDAALAAADAADAATAAAQDASDAVAALSATVAKLVASLKAQITSLTNLVIKIQKKVKA